MARRRCSIDYMHGLRQAGQDPLREQRHSAEPLTRDVLERPGRSLRRMRFDDFSAAAIDRAAAGARLLEVAV